MPSPYSLEGCVVVTGGSGILGSAFSRALASAGAAVIVEHTPAGRLGEPGDLVSTLLWLCSPASRFVTGIVVPVDGGFGAFSGV